MKKLIQRLTSLFGRAQRKAAPRKIPMFSTRVATQVETIIASSGPDFAFAFLPTDDEDIRVFIPASTRLVGGDWFSVRPGRRVRLAVVEDRHGRGLRALGLTFLDTADSAA